LVDYLHFIIYCKLVLSQCRGRSRIFKGWGANYGCWCLGVAESMGHLPEMLRTGMKTVEMTVRCLFREFVFISTTIFTIVLNIFALLLQKRGS